MKLLGYVLLGIIIYAIYKSAQTRETVPGANAATIPQISGAQNPNLYSHLISRTIFVGGSYWPKRRM